MAASSSGSSFTSSLSHRARRGISQVSPVDSTWTHTSGISTISDPSTASSVAPQALSFRPLDLGPPGYTATLTLYPDTADERTVYLGPWEITESEPRCILWQCSYQNELLEHYLPSENPLDFHPHTLHSRHRQFHDPSDMERRISFVDLQRIRYTTDDGVCIHDDFVAAKYEFTTISSSVQFQGDLRRKKLMGFYDVDVVWTDKHSRTDSYGKVKGLGAIQRLKLWKDNQTLLHSLSILANKTDNQFHEYHVRIFDGEPREESHRRIRLNVNTRRGSISNDLAAPLVSLSQLIRPRARSSRRNDRARVELGGGASSRVATVDIRHLDFQFTNNEGYHQFLADWERACRADRSLHGSSFNRSHAGFSPHEAGPA